MKKGCLFLLVLWTGLSAAYYRMLQGTKHDGIIWLPVLLGLAFVLLISNVIALASAIRQRRLSGRSRMEWRDGDLICVSGPIHASAKPLTMPFSGRPVVVGEYDVKTRAQGGETSASADITGMLMTPCSIHARDGHVRLIGFPLLAQIGDRTFDDPTSYQHAARYLLNTQFSDKPKNPFELLKRIGEILADDDGDVKADMKEASISIEELSFGATDGDLLAGPDEDDGADDDDTLDRGGDDTGALIEMRVGQQRISGPSIAGLTDNERRLAESLEAAGYRLVERAIEEGDVVTAFGTFRGNKQALDVGSGMSNLNHQLHLGPASSVIGKQIAKTLIALVISTTIFVGAHGALAVSIGKDPRTLVEKLIPL